MEMVQQVSTGGCHAKWLKCRCGLIKTIDIVEMFFYQSSFNNKRHHVDKNISISFMDCLLILFTHTGYWNIDNFVH